MNLVVGNSYQFFQTSRPLMKVGLATSGPNLYDPNNDRITIVSVWGAFGNFAQAHEFGHALQEKALGGLVHGANDCPDLGAGVGHPYDREQSLRCAVGEGFASYHAVAVMGSGAAYYNEIEQNSMLDSGEEGSIVPHTVAAFLYDLTDNRTEIHDAVQYPGRYVADIFRTCTGNSFSRADGIDHIIWCLEGTVDSAITGSASFFPQRGTHPVWITEGATEPGGHSQQAIRALWMANIYP